MLSTLYSLQFTSITLFRLIKIHQFSTHTVPLLFIGMFHQFCLLVLFLVSHGSSYLPCVFLGRTCKVYDNLSQHNDEMTNRGVQWDYNATMKNRKQRVLMSKYTFTITSLKTQTFCSLVFLYLWRMLLSKAKR